MKRDARSVTAEELAEKPVIVFTLRMRALDGHTVEAMQEIIGRAMVAAGVKSSAIQFEKLTKDMRGVSSTRLTGGYADT